MPRCLGSKRSLSQSPAKLKAKTTSMIAIPGVVVTHQAVETYSLPSANMEPQAGVGGGMPAPRKLSDASTIITQPTCRVSRTINVGITFGKRWRIMMRQSDAPDTSALAMKSRCIKPKTSPLITRA